MWWFILIACVLPIFGWLLFDVIGNLAILGCILSLFGYTRIRQIMGIVILAIYLPTVVLIVAVCTDLWWSYGCWSGSQDACTYDTIFLPELHPGTPDLWHLNLPFVPPGKTV
jgi:hypothetical protein